MPQDAGSIPPSQLRIGRRQLLQGVSIFSSLSEAELDGLLAATTSRRLSRGEVLFRKGDPGRQLYGLVQGRLRSRNVEAQENGIIDLSSNHWSRLVSQTPSCGIMASWTLTMLEPLG